MFAEGNHSILEELNNELPILRMVLLNKALGCCKQQHSGPTGNGEPLGRRKDSSSAIRR